MCIVQCREPKRVSKGSNLKEDDMALPPRCVEENEILYAKFRVVSRFPTTIRVISRKIDSVRAPLEVIALC